MDLQLTGRRALVTGGSSGIGKAVVRALTAEGAVVTVHGRNPERVRRLVASVEEQGGTAHGVIGDFVDPAAVHRVAEEALAALGGVDILINAAGGRTAADPEQWSCIRSTVWHDTFQLNVVAPAVLASALVPHMRRRNWGRIIHVSSAAAFRPLAGNPEYSACKASLAAMTVSLMQDLAGTAITVNTVSPGATGTPGLLGAMGEQARLRGLPDDDECLRTRALEFWPCATGRLADAAEVASLVAYLAGERGAFVNGANLRIDGGRGGVVT